MEILRLKQLLLCEQFCVNNFESCFKKCVRNLRFRFAFFQRRGALGFLNLESPGERSLGQIGAAGAAEQQTPLVAGVTLR